MMFLIMEIKFLPKLLLTKVNENFYLDFSLIV